jgi:hypothetical protein
MEASKPPIINQLALTDDVEGLWSVENRYQSSAKAFLHDQDPLRTFSSVKASRSSIIQPSDR